MRTGRRSGSFSLLPTPSNSFRFPLRATPQVDAATLAASSAFDYSFDGTGEPFVEPTLPALSAGWRVGLVLGPSGSGKSTVLRRLCEQHARAAAGPPRTAADLGGEGVAPGGTWPADAPAASAVPGGAAALAPFGAALADAADRRPFGALSRGERTLVALARLCAAPSSDAPSAAPAPAPAPKAAAPAASAASAAAGPPRLSIADEFTSFVDRRAAATAAAATRAAWLRRAGTERLVCASVHDDVLLQLRPDWSYDAKTRQLTTYVWAPEDLTEEADEAAAAEAEAAEAEAVEAVAAVAAAAADALPAAASGGPTSSQLLAAVPPTAASLFAPPRVEVVVRQTMLMSGERENDPKDGDTRKYNEAKWQLFKEHHYMDAKLSSSATCFLARWGRLPVGFVAVMCQPATLPKDEPRILWREHRLVVHTSCPSALTQCALTRTSLPDRPRDTRDTPLPCQLARTPPAAVASPDTSRCHRLPRCYPTSRGSASARGSPMRRARSFCSVAGATRRARRTSCCASSGEARPGGARTHIATDCH